MREEAFNIGYTSQSDLEMRYCGYENCIPGFISRPHIRDCYLIHYIVQGTGYYQFNNKTYEVKKNDIFVIFPNHLVTYNAPNHDDPWTFCWFAFSGDKAQQYLDEVGIHEDNPVMQLPPNNSVEILIKKCVDSITNEKKISPFNLKGYLYLLFSNLERTHDSAITVQKNNKNIETAKMYIENNYMYPISVETVSSFVHLERTYFSKLFHRHTGVSPQDYITNYRIEIAKQLMKTTNMRIKEICACIGIQDPYYFSKVFKKIVGVAPTKYQLLDDTLQSKPDLEKSSELA